MSRLRARGLQGQKGADQQQYRTRDEGTLIPVGLYVTILSSSLSDHNCFECCFELHQHIINWPTHLCMDDRPIYKY